MLSPLRISNDHRSVRVFACEGSLDGRSRIVGQNVPVPRTPSPVVFRVVFPDILLDVRSESSLRDNPPVLLGVEATVEVQVSVSDVQL